MIIHTGGAFALPLNTYTIMIITRAKNGYAAQLQQKCIDVMQGCQCAAAPRMSERDTESIRSHAEQIANILSKY